MNLRGLAIFALVLAVVAVVAWFVIGGGMPPTVSEPDSGLSAARVETSQVGEVPAPAVPPLHGGPSTAPELPVATPTESVRMISSVAPGMPLVRTTPAPMKPGGVALAPGQGRPEPPSEIKSDLEGVQFMLRDFRTRMGENPVGSNAEIMRAVMGGNEAKAQLGPPAGQSLNGNGELVDRWGTPYFFHQLSKTSMEIRSAGPDGRLWTADDVVVK